MSNPVLDPERLSKESFNHFRESQEGKWETICLECSCSQYMSLVDILNSLPDNVDMDDVVLTYGEEAMYASWPKDSVG